MSQITFSFHDLFYQSTDLVVHLLGISYRPNITAHQYHFIFKTSFKYPQFSEGGNYKNCLSIDHIVGILVRDD